jgi:copper chaperone
MEQMTLAIDGMSCSHCVAAVRGALEELDGVRAESVTIGNAVVAYDPRKANPREIVAAVDAAGYHARAGEPGAGPPLSGERSA